MYVNQKQYCYNHHQRYSYKEIEDRLKAISNIDKANSWIYPDLTTKPISSVAKVIRCIKSPLVWLADPLSVFRAIKFPLDWITKQIYKWNGIEIEKSKLFLAEIKKCARANFDSYINILADQAISQFNHQFPKHQLRHHIQMPLLDSEDKEYELKLFQSDLSTDAKYMGANQVIINDNCMIPRTLYHLLFIYFALKNGNNDKIYPILKTYIEIGTLVEDKLRERAEKDHEDTVNKLHAEILNLFKERDLVTDQLTWKNVKALVENVCQELETIHETVGSHKNPNYTKKKQVRELFYHFYCFCFNVQDHGTKFKEITLRAVALEWGSPSNTEILYRGAQISTDDISKGETCAHSLSFSSSLFAGLVFEGTPTGTCSYVYYHNLADKQLYALQLSHSKIEKYFYYPTIFKCYGLLPLVAKGEFSHPRLKIFTTEKTTRVTGVQGQHEQAKKTANFTPSLKINELAKYRKKIVKLFQKNIYLLGV